MYRKLIVNSGESLILKVWVTLVLRRGERVRLGGRLLAALAVVGLVVLPFASSGHAQPAVSPPAFSGSAAAGGVRATLNVPGAPATDTPMDGGGPTAQVAVDSIGTSTGYAAFPDPGQFLVSIPGLAVGLLAGGAGGLPPIKLPSPPNYPFFVQSDASNVPEAQVGSGPLALSASSRQGQSSAKATTGFETGLVGDAAFVSSSASLVPSPAGGEMAKATADVQGLTVGPLTLGEVKTVATEAMDSSGAVTPSTELSIAGLRVGGVPVELAPQGLVAGGPIYPVPLNSSLNSLLKSSGITMQFVAAERFPDRVVAPALQITMPFAMPFKVPNVGQFSGTLTVIIGSATAQLSGAAAEAGVGGESGPGLATSTEGSASSGELAVPGAEVPANGGKTPESLSLAGVPTTSGGSPSAPSLALPRSAAPADRARPVALAGAIDVRSMYLVILVGVMVAVGAGQLIRRLGGQV